MILRRRFILAPELILKSTFRVDIYGPWIKFPIRVEWINGECRGFVWKVCFMVRIFYTNRTKEKFQLIRVWARVRWVSVYFYLLRWFLWQLAMCLLRLHFVHRLWYAGNCPCWWELPDKFQFIWDYLLCCLSCSLWLVWVGIISLSFVYVLWTKCPFLESQKLWVP